MTSKHTHIALRYALLGSVIFAVSCTTSSISTPSFNPTAALQNIKAGNDDGEVTAQLPESTTIVPTGATDTAQAPVNALALNAPAAPSEAASAISATTRSDVKKGAVDIAALSPNDPLADVKAAANTEDTTTSEAETQIAAVNAPKEPEVEKTTRITTGDPKPRAEVRKPTVMRALPGVKVKNIFGISQATNTAKRIGEEVNKPVQLASASIGSAARSVANGIRKQTDRVSVKCFRPELVKMIKRIERHYGKPVVVTSGYRSPKRNRRAGGSKKSLHMYCAAADVQVKGISKWALAKYIRSMPGRGGVGTYCHTKSVHLDIGSKRDWNWRCRRK